MSDIKPTLSDIKVALAMGFRMFDGQDAGDALDDYIAEVRADATEKERAAAGGRVLEVIYKSGKLSFMPDLEDALIAAARGEGSE